MNKEDLYKEKAKAVIEFVDTIIGSYNFGFIDEPHLSLSDIYRGAEAHVLDIYGVKEKNIIEKYGESIALELGLKLDSK